MLRRGRNVLFVLAVVHLLADAGDFLYYTVLTRDEMRGRAAASADVTGAMSSHEQHVICDALTGMLLADGVPNAQRWARAIVRHSPTTDSGYIALMTAVIRRESNFSAPDLEWLYDRAVPDVLHQAGMDDLVRTIGPMQIQRHQLGAMMADQAGGRLDEHSVKTLADDINTGVYYAIRYMDRLVQSYIPDRRVLGWFELRGSAGLVVEHASNQPPLWDATTLDDRMRIASLQKLLSDITTMPLTLDGVVGPRTIEAARRCAAWLGSEQRSAFLDTFTGEGSGGGPSVFDNDSVRSTIRGIWSGIYAVEPPLAIFPRLSHDPRLTLVLADFNCGPGSCRVAAMQMMLGDLLGDALAMDGKLGPKTAEAIRRFLVASELSTERAAEFADLLRTGHKQQWVRGQLHAIISRAWSNRFGGEAPNAICPDIGFDSLAQQIKGIGRMTTRDHVIGSLRFFEDYHTRLQHELSRRSTGGMLN